jgi:hypothetical protein
VAEEWPNGTPSMPDNILIEQIINTPRPTHSLRSGFPHQSSPTLYLQYFEL